MRNEIGLLKYIGLYLILINTLGFALMGIDKHRARKKKWRIPERSLFICAFLGGALGAAIGMRSFHHKTKHWYFKYGLPLIFLMQAALLVFLYIKGYILL
jgi:uncharacterized membrane protein YsdA (DUF1294 family)